jgi:uncharacterized lipoprotein YajG
MIAMRSCLSTRNYSGFFIAKNIAKNYGLNDSFNDSPNESSNDASTSRTMMANHTESIEES